MAHGQSASARLGARAHVIGVLTCDTCFAPLTMLGALTFNRVPEWTSERRQWSAPRSIPFPFCSTSNMRPSQTDLKMACLRRALAKNCQFILRWGNFGAPILTSNRAARDQEIAEYCRIVKAWQGIAWAEGWRRRLPRYPSIRIAGPSAFRQRPQVNVSGRTRTRTGARRSLRRLDRPPSHTSFHTPQAF